jgi:phosphonate transport system substrate-binding protein
VGEGTECEAGFAEDSEVAKSDKVRVVDKTMVPGAPIVMASALPSDVQQSLNDTLSKVTVDDMVAAGISSANSAAFREVFYATAPVDDAYYNTIRGICEKTQAKQCKQ